MGRFSNLTRINQEASTLSAHYLGVSERSLVQRSPSISALTGAVSSARVFEETQSSQEAQEQYRHYKGWVYTAIKTIANRLAGQPYGVGKRLKGKNPSKGSKLYMPVGDLAPQHMKSHLLATQIEVIQDHELLTSLRRPNHRMTAWGLMYDTAASLMLTGKSFWWFTKSTRRRGGKDVWPVPSSWVTFVYDKDFKFRHYAVRRPNSLQESQPIMVPDEEMMFFSIPDPGDPLGTISPLQTQATAVATDEALQMAQFRAFKNGIHPSVMIQVGKFDGMAGMPGEVPLLSPDQRKDLVGAIQALYGGVLNYGDPIILDALIEKVEKFSHTPEEMDFLDSGESIKKRIFEAFGVNPILTGQTDGANRAQAAVADGIFCNSVINPMCDMIGQTVTAHMTEYGEDDDMMFWIEPARPNDDELKLKEYIAALTNYSVTSDEYRANVLGMPGLTDKQKKELHENAAIKVTGKTGAGTSGGSAQSATSSGGASRG